MNILNVIVYPFSEILLRKLHAGICNTIFTLDKCVQQRSHLSNGSDLDDIITRNQIITKVGITKEVEQQKKKKNFFFYKLNF